MAIQQAIQQAIQRAHPTTILLSAYDLRRAPLPVDMPDTLRHIIEAWRAMDATRLALCTAWADAAHAGRPNGIEREWRDQVFELIGPLKVRALAAWDLWQCLRGQA